MAISEGRLFLIHEHLLNAKEILTKASAEMPGDIRDELEQFAYEEVCEALDEFTLIDQPVTNNEKEKKNEIQNDAGTTSSVS